MASRTVRDATADDDGFPRHIGDRSRGTYWLFETDHDDKIGPSHFERFTISSPATTSSAWKSSPRTVPHLSANPSFASPCAESPSCCTKYAR